MLNTSEITISRSALAHNLSFLHNKYGPSVICSSVVKGNAYGHGIEVFAPLAEELGVKHFSVFSADEAFRVQKATQNSPTIMIMGDIPNDELEWAIENGIEFFVFELDRLEHAIEAAKKVGKPAQVHVELETGMNRTGFEPYTKEKLLGILKDNPHLHFKGLCMHFAGAESIANYVRVKKQKLEFLNASKWFRKNDMVPEIRHTCCSAASIRLPEMWMDMVRIGIMQYGFWPSLEIYIEHVAGREDKTDPLQRLISWKSRVMSVKNVKTGQFVGYGTTYIAHKDMQIAMVPIGYAHGFSRSLSNQGRVLIRGQRLGVIGIVNMNCIAVDVSGIGGVEKGDEVVLIGHQGDLSISVASFGELSEQLNYELLTRLPHDIPRRVVD